MAYVLTDESNYEDIADAIREKAGTSATYKPSEMAAAVRGIQTGGDVTSVNGKTGDVMLSASDVGAGTYSKPSGGIPKSDLASTVQTSLDKADTAMQDVAKINGGLGLFIPLKSELDYPIKMGTAAFNGQSRTADIYIAVRDIVDAEHDTSDAWSGPRTTASAYAGNVDLALESLKSLEVCALAAYPTDKVSGIIAQFTDGADDVPVKALVVDIASQSGVTGATITRRGKNLIPYPYIQATMTKDGITFTVQSDGSVRVQGTATSNAATFRLVATDAVKQSLVVGQRYKVTTYNGGNSGFGPWDDCWLQVYSGDGGITGDDRGYNEFTWQGSNDCDVDIRVANGKTVDTVVYPMIRLASDADASYEAPIQGGHHAIDWSSLTGAITEGTWDVLHGILKTGGQTYDVTPVEIKTLYGFNTIYADCGDVDVTYRADTTLYINRKISEANA